MTMNTNPPPKIVDLNVGGKYYTTSLDTLSRDRDSMLHAMFSGQYHVATDSQGRYFIDRDGDLFGYVLNFLRDGSIDVGTLDAHKRERLLREAQFYLLKGLEDLLTAKKHFKHNSSMSSALTSSTPNATSVNPILKHLLEKDAIPLLQSCNQKCDFVFVFISNSYVFTEPPGPFNNHNFKPYGLTDHAIIPKISSWYREQGYKMIQMNVVEQAQSKQFFLLYEKFEDDS